MRQLLVLALIVGVVYLIKVLLLPRGRTPDMTQPRADATVTEEMVQDPFCRTYLPRSQAIRRHIRGQDHYFCSPGCIEKFQALRV
jgi:YHS domain-containing protein